MQRIISYFHLTYFSFPLLYFCVLLSYKRFAFSGFFFFFFCDPIRDSIRDPVRDPVRDRVCDPVQVLSTPCFIDCFFFSIFLRQIIVSCPKKKTLCKSYSYRLVALFISHDWVTLCLLSSVHVFVSNLADELGWLFSLLEKYRGTPTLLLLELL